tara:strand:- start:359 stop:625 length:267 start_codon:yes stop_codon:yes gene_type:complete
MVMNVACGGKITVNELHSSIIEIMRSKLPNLETLAPEFLPPREGDILHSLANIDRATSELGYKPTVSILEGLQKTVSYSLSNNKGAFD